MISSYSSAQVEQDFTIVKKSRFLIYLLLGGVACLLVGGCCCCCCSSRNKVRYAKEIFCCIYEDINDREEFCWSNKDRYVKE